MHTHGSVICCKVNNTDELIVKEFGVPCRDQIVPIKYFDSLIPTLITDIHSPDDRACEGKGEEDVFEERRPGKQDVALNAWIV